MSYTETAEIATSPRPVPVGEDYIYNQQAEGWECFFNGRYVCTAATLVEATGEVARHIIRLMHIKNLYR